MKQPMNKELFWSIAEAFTEQIKAHDDKVRKAVGCAIYSEKQEERNKYLALADICQEEKRRARKNLEQFYGLYEPNMEEEKNETF